MVHVCQIRLERRQRVGQHKLVVEGLSFLRANEIACTIQTVDAGVAGTGASVGNSVRAWVGTDCVVGAVVGVCEGD